MYNISKMKIVVQNSNGSIGKYSLSGIKGIYIHEICRFQKNDSKLKCVIENK